MRLTVKAPAKLNLFLHVNGRRPGDQYHMLQSLMVPLGIGDVISASDAEEIELVLAPTQHSQSLATLAPGENIIVKALNALRRALGEKRGIRIILEKHLPAASGMGGGSSDAAAALKAALKFWQRQIDESELHKIALSLGADVPFFIKAKPAFIEGIGEKITPVHLPSMPVLVVNPGVPVNTAQIFQMGIPQFSEHMDLPKYFADEASLIGFLKRQRNDLLPNATRIVPGILKLLTLINAQAGCRYMQMSGSGATCFGIFDTDEQAKAAAEKLKPAYPVIWATHF